MSKEQPKREHATLYLVSADGIIKDATADGSLPKGWRRDDAIIVETGGQQYYVLLPLKYKPWWRRVFDAYYALWRSL